MILLAIPAVGVTLVTIVAFFGRWSWFLDVLANFRVQYAAVLAFMGVFLLLGRWYRTATVVIFGILVNLAVIVPLYLGEGRSVPTEEPLLVMSFNVYSNNDQFGEVAAFIRELDPDMVFLHEVWRPWEVAIEAAGLPYQTTLSRSENLDYGTLVLSRPGDPVTSYGFTLRGPRAVEVVHDGVAVLSVHPLAPTTAERAGLRDAQLEFAAEWANRQTRSHIVVGDFNATPWSYAFRRLLAETELENSQRGFGVQPTFPADESFLLRVPIDHLLHSPDLVIADRRLGPSLGSDHFPLIVELWAPGGGD